MSLQNLQTHDKNIYNNSGRRPGGKTLSTDKRQGKACRAFWRHISDNRLYVK